VGLGGTWVEPSTEFNSEISLISTLNALNGEINLKIFKKLKIEFFEVLIEASGNFTAVDDLLTDWSARYHYSSFRGEGLLPLITNRRGK
jgi:hypothetical protein